MSWWYDEFYCSSTDDYLYRATHRPDAGLPTLEVIRCPHCGELIVREVQP